MATGAGLFEPYMLSIRFIFAAPAMAPKIANRIFMRIKKTRKNKIPGMTVRQNTGHQRPLTSARDAESDCTPRTLSSIKKRRANMKLTPSQIPGRIKRIIPPNTARPVKMEIQINGKNRDQALRDSSGSGDLPASLANMQMRSRMIVQIMRTLFSSTTSWKRRALIGSEEAP